MPFKSKAQQRFMFAAEERGEIPKGKAREWAHKTKNIKRLPEYVKKSSADLAMDVLNKVGAYDAVRESVLATDGRSSVLHDIFNGGKWAPGGVEYQGPMKIAAELPTNLKDRPPTAIGSVVGVPKPKAPKVKKTAAEIAAHVLAKTAAYGG